MQINPLESIGVEVVPARVEISMDLKFEFIEDAKKNKDKGIDIFATHSQQITANSSAAPSNSSNQVDD